jgi:hypothetical protein
MINAKFDKVSTISVKAKANFVAAKGMAIALDTNGEAVPANGIFRTFGLLSQGEVLGTNGLNNEVFGGVFHDNSGMVEIVTLGLVEVSPSVVRDGLGNQTTFVPYVASETWLVGEAIKTDANGLLSNSGLGNVIGYVKKPFSATDPVAEIMVNVA